MSARPRALGYALAALSAVLVIGLGVRISGQLDDLSAAHGDLTEAATNAAQLRAQAEGGIGPPLLDARVEPPSAALARRLKALGFTVRQSTLVAATPAGRNLVVARLTAEGEADPAAVDRLALWTGASARSAILESLTATANADGKSEVKLELDALVRQTDGKPSPARPI
jgi:hypothetical protein